MEILDQMGNDLKELAGQYAMFEQEKFDDKTKELKFPLGPKILKLKDLKMEIDSMEVTLKKIKTKYNDILF